ncbi:MAG: nucleotide exchange factor GrpE [Candidatus Marinimicrobia bacterium]|nr:nucleotide exchange factor GrpE [Candidatus Neomarinimicrobiota bacterium]
MTDEKSKKDPKVKETSLKEPAKSKKVSPPKEEKKKVESKKEKKSDPKKPLLTQKEIDKLILENADLKAENKESKDNFLLLAAEFENFKKRINKDQQRSIEYYKENILGDLLSVLDDIDRALQHHEDDETGKAFTMIRNKLLSYMEGFEIRPFESVGHEFDPDKHNAMLTRAVENEKDNMILEEFEKGYMIGKKVLRHAKVIVNIIE